MAALPSLVGMKIRKTTAIVFIRFHQGYQGTSTGYHDPFDPPDLQGFSFMSQAGDLKLEKTAQGSWWAGEQQNSREITGK